jgi:hypothetical protein
MSTPNNLPETLKVMGSYNRRMIALIIILLAGLAGMTIKAYYGKSDCASVQSQVDRLTESQGKMTEAQAKCVQSNMDLMNRNQELTAIIIHVDSVLGNIRPDTVFIKPEVLDREYVAKKYSDSGIMMAPPPPPEVKEVKKDIIFKKGNTSKITLDVRNLIKSNIK